MVMGGSPKALERLSKSDTKTFRAPTGKILNQVGVNCLVLSGPRTSQGVVVVLAMWRGVAGVPRLLGDLGVQTTSNTEWIS